MKVIRFQGLTISVIELKMLIAKKERVNTAYSGECCLYQSGGVDESADSLPTV